MKFSYTAIVTTKEFSFIYIELSLLWVSVLLVDFLPKTVSNLSILLTLNRTLTFFNAANMLQANVFFAQYFKFFIFFSNRRKWEAKNLQHENQVI